jgi:hypothetical protein
MAQDDKKGFFKSDLFKNLTNKLPYQPVDFDNVFGNLNPKYPAFQQLGMDRNEALAKNSIFYNNGYNEQGAAAISRDGDYAQLVYSNIDENKGGRLSEYRVMAAFAEVATALDEICDECVNLDDEGRVAYLKIKNTEIDSEYETLLKEEFQKYVDHFELEKKGFEYFRQLLIEGEVYFEHIIHNNHIDEGILGAVTLPCELIDPIFDNIQNMMIKGYILRKPIFDPQKPEKVVGYDLIPMEENQITYVHSGVWNHDKTFRMPHIENGRRAYRQLSLIEDSIVIYRLVRAPERLVFNVDTGNLPPPKAEAYLRKLIQQYWSKKTFDTNQEGQVQKFNPQSMLDSFWFAKRTGSEGTSVTQLEGGQNLGELTDLLYFVEKLYKALKVPGTRINPEQGFSDGNEILRQELRFANFIIRLQQQFANGLKNGFIAHLKLKKLDKKFDIKAHNIDITMNVPTNFYEMRESQKLSLRMDNFNAIAGNESISPTFAQKLYLGWDDDRIKANRHARRKDAETDWEIAQITAGGPDWRENMEQGVEGAEGDLGGADLGGGGGGIPDFGGAPADAGGTEDIPVEPETPVGEPVPEEPVA